jgi:hypothetical protein
MAKAKEDTEATPKTIGIAVESADLQTAAMIPGISTFTSINQAKSPGIKMQLMPYGLHCWAKGKEFVIPSANVKSVILAK